MTNIATFNAVGVSRQFGKLKIRMANDIEWRRIMLTKEGHTDIQLISLGEQLTKIEAVTLAVAATSIQDDGSLAATFDAEAQECFVKYLQSVGAMERPKKARGRKAKADQVEPAAEVAEPTEALVEAVTLTLDDIPKRDAKGRLLSGKTRQLMLEEALAAQEEVA
jgi:hypothetical protein